MSFYLGVNFVSHPKVGTLFEEVREKGAEDRIWAQERTSKSRTEKLHNEELHNL
jgi:hypothetical protein